VLHRGSRQLSFIERPTSLQVLRDYHVGCREMDEEEEGAAAEEGSNDGL
jgi:hypothetical protein